MIASKTISPADLVSEYRRQNPGEFPNGVTEAQAQDLAQTFGNWLERYAKDPDGATAMSPKTWAGKVTRAFAALMGVKIPKTKPALLALLAEATPLSAARREAYRKVIDDYGINPEDHSWSGGEDAWQYLNGEAPVTRYCLLTMSGDFKYAYADGGDTMDEAKERAVENIDDNLFAETPVQIVDLDTGEVFMPLWKSLIWGVEDKSFGIETKPPETFYPEAKP